MRFKFLKIGAIFNTIIGRWVKISDTEAVYIMGSLREIGAIEDIPYDLQTIDMGE